jgi:arylsulfatase A-like enzyme
MTFVSAAASRLFNLSIVLIATACLPASIARAQEAAPRLEQAVCGTVAREAYFVSGGKPLQVRLPASPSLRRVQVAYCSPDPHHVDRISATLATGDGAGRPLHDVPIVPGRHWTDLEVALSPAELRAQTLTLTFHAPPLRDFPGSAVEGTFVSVVPIHDAADDRPNIILISLDTLRADRLIEYGYSQPTDPNIAALSSAGVVFTQAISQAPSTPPAHAALFTGLYPARTGLFVTRDVGSAAAVADFTLRPSIPTLAERLRSAGYYTAAFTGGGFVSRNFGFARGFDRFAEETSTIPGELMRTGAEALNWVERNGDKRFFLFLHTYEVHVGPFGYQHEAFWHRADTRPFYERYNGHGDGPVNNARYDSSIQFSDAVLGQFFRLLAARGTLGRTLIVITSDHGETMDERAAQAGYVYNHGFSLYDELIRVPLIFHWPSGLPASRRVDQQVELVDVMPTLLDLARVPGAETLDGRSLAPLLRGAAGYDKRVAYSESVAGGPFRSAIRAGGYKYVRVLDRTPTSATPMTPPPDEELYDLRADPGERVNLAADARHAAVLAAMRRDLDAWLARAGTLEIIAAARASAQRRASGEDMHGRVVAPGDGVRRGAGRPRASGDGGVR